MTYQRTNTHTYMFVTDSGSQNISVEECCFVNVRNSNRNMIQLAQLPNFTRNRLRTQQSQLITGQDIC